MSSDVASGWPAALVALEHRLRARGLTGSEAFDRLLPAIEARAGVAPSGPVDDEVLDFLRALPDPSGLDVLGLGYEQFLPEVYRGKRGQYFTPPAIGRLLWSRLRAGPGTIVLDPTCGSGGLLVHAASTGATLRGIDLDPRLARLASANLRLLGVAGVVVRADFFRATPEPVDVLVANPPFSVVLDDPEVVDAHRALGGPKGVLSDLVFLEQVHRWVRAGGRAGVVVPYSVLANPTFAALRHRLVERFRIDAVVTLPEGVFRPFGGAGGRAAILWLTRRPAADGPTWFRALTDPGWDVRSRRLRFTSSSEVDTAVRGEGFAPLRPDTFLPTPGGRGPTVGDLAAWVRTRGRAPLLAELADADPSSGDLAARPAAPPRRLPLLRPGDLAFSRLRPELGTVGVVVGDAEIAGSPEWIVVRPAAHPRWLRHALRTPVFRRALPATTGQTRPRTSPRALLDAPVPTPDEGTRALVDRVSELLSAQRRRATDGLLRLQALVDAHAEGTLPDEALRAAVERILAELGRG